MKPDKSTIAVLYARVSTEEQKRKETIQAQRTAAQVWSQRTGVPIQGVYADEGVSGTIPFEKRPEGKRLLEDARAGKFNTVVFRELERIGRDVEPIHLARKLLENVDLTLVSITEGFDLSTLGGEVHFGMSAVIAAYTRKQFLARARAGRFEVVRKGKWAGGRPPYGYRIGDDGKLIIQTTPIPGLRWSESDVVKNIFSWVVNDRLPMFKIADRLNKDHIPTPSRTAGKTITPRKVPSRNRSNFIEGQWLTTTINYILHHTIYKGINTFGRLSRLPVNKRQTEVQEFPAIVSPEVWQEAQDRLKKNQQWSKRNTKHQYLLSGLLRCGFCGLSLRGQVHSDKKKLYYSCSGLLRQNRDLLKITCQQRHLPAVWIEERVWNELAGWVLSQKNLEVEARQALEDLEQQRQELRDSLKSTEQDLAGIVEQRKELLRGFRKGLISDDELEQQGAELRAEQEHLQIVHGEIEKQLATAIDPKRAIAEVKKSLAYFRTALRKKTVAFDVKRKLVETFVHEVVVAVKQRAALPAIEKEPLRQTIPYTQVVGDLLRYTGLAPVRERLFTSGKNPQEGRPLQRRAIEIHYRFPFPPEAGEGFHIVNSTGRSAGLDRARPSSCVPSVDAQAAPLAPSHDRQCYRKSVATQGQRAAHAPWSECRQHQSGHPHAL